jgi:hypothetical protein
MRESANFQKIAATKGSAMTEAWDVAGQGDPGDETKR